MSMDPELARQRPEVVKDEPAIKEVISKVKSQGLFDQFRKECIADVDTKPAYHNLLQRVESYVEHFLQEQKWSTVGNKNQLREKLRRQLNSSGMMHNGVERIIEQVVNPKILLGIKPKIDEAVCSHLGIDLKARQEEQQRKKQEQQRLLLQQQQLQQQNLQSQINQNVKSGADNFDSSNNQPPFGGNMGPWGHGGMANFPSPSVQGGVGNPMAGMPGANPQGMMNFPGMAQPFSMMGGWSPGFNPAMPPMSMIPGQPMIPAFPGAPGMPPSVSPFTANISPAAGGSIPTSTPPCPAPPPPAPGTGIPDLSKPPPGLPNTPMSSASTSRSPIVPPGTTSMSRAPMGSIPPPPGTVPVIPPVSTSVSLPTRGIPTTPTIPALISHTLAKASEDNLTPERIAVFKTAAAIITKTVSNAQGTPGADIATMFSPHMLAEAMKEESGTPLTKHELRAARRKERFRELDRLRALRDQELLEGIKKAEDKEDPLPPTNNLMDAFQGAEDVSDDEEALDLLMDIDETTEDKHKTGIILSDESDKEESEQPPTRQSGKRYNFAWDVDINPQELSDVTVSSIHTSDISSYEEDSPFSDSEHEEQDEKPHAEAVEVTSAADKEIVDDIGEPTNVNGVKDEDIKLDEVKIENSDKTEEGGEEKGVVANTEKMEETVEEKTVVKEEIDEDITAEDENKITEEVTATEVKIKEEEDEIEKKDLEEKDSVEKYAEGKDEAEEKGEDGLSTMEDSKMASSLPVIAEEILKTSDGLHEEPKLHPETAKQQQATQPLKPRKLLALSSHFSDSDDDETREERKARIAREKEERYLKRQQRRAELEAKRKEREEEKARLKEERKRQKEQAAEIKQEENAGSSETTMTEDQSLTTTPVENESKSSKTTPTPQKKKNKAELKEQLLQQKVMERKAALRRRRTRNRRYASDEFTTIFTERKSLNQGYGEDIINPEEIVTFDGAVEVVELTVDQECVVETVSEEIATTEEQGSSGLVLQCPSPYSDISDRSMSDKSELSIMDNVSVDKVSSDEELDDDSDEEKIMEEFAAEVDAQGEVTPLSHGMLESEDVSSQLDGVQSLTTSDPVSPRSRMSTRSKSVVSQDEFDNTNSSILDEKSSQKSMVTSQLNEDKEFQSSLCDGGMASIGKSPVSDSAINTGKADEMVREKAEVRAASPKDIMADLELEPVSDDDSSLGGLSEVEKEPDDLDKEEGEEKESDEEVTRPPRSNEKERPPMISTHSEDARAEDDDNASDEGEIKSDSEEDTRKSKTEATMREEDTQRTVARKPIEFVDFGEAEKRARGSRGVLFSENDRRRGVPNVPPPTSSYRANYAQWPQSSGGPPAGPYSSSSSRYALDQSSPARSKSPGAAFGAESEAGSHGRTSVRVREDVPPPYSIEGVARKHKLSGAPTQSSTGLYKPLGSHSSPVSSSTRSSRSKSSSRSRSRSSSRSGSSYSYSSASHSSSRKRKRSKKRKKRKRRSARSKSKDRTPSVRSHSPSSRLSFPERSSPSRRLPETSVLPGSSSNSQVALGKLSSGNESISSDELPDYFPEEETERPSSQSKKSKRRKLSGGSSFSGSSSSISKPPMSPGQASISSSELIYSPSRKRVQESGDSDASVLNEPQRKKPKKRRRTSSSRQSASSNEEELVSPRIETGLVYSPVRPSSPGNYPPLPDDMSGFQPPLPQESPDHPPLPCSSQPPPPPLPPGSDSPPHQPMTPPFPPPPPDEIEEGECPSTPEYEDHSTAESVEHEAPPYSPINANWEGRKKEDLSQMSPSPTGEESVDVIENNKKLDVVKDDPVRHSESMDTTGDQKDLCQTRYSSSSPSFAQAEEDRKEIKLSETSDKDELTERKDSSEEKSDSQTHKTASIISNSNNDGSVQKCSDSRVTVNVEIADDNEIQTLELKDTSTRGSPEIQEPTEIQEALEESDTSTASKSLKHSAGDCTSPTAESQPPSKRQKDEGEEDQ